jgi:hypothetical protein
MRTDDLFLSHSSFPLTRSGAEVLRVAYRWNLQDNSLKSRTKVSPSP